MSKTTRVPRTVGTLIALLKTYDPKRRLGNYSVFVEMMPLDAIAGLGIGIVDLVGIRRAGTLKDFMACKSLIRTALGLRGTEG